MRLRFLADRDEADLEEAVELARRATQIGPENDADALGNLSQVLQTRFDLHPYSTEIGEAVDVARQALKADGDHLARPKTLLVLGQALLARIVRYSYHLDPRGESGREQDRAEALRVLSELVRSPLAPPRLRVHGAKPAAWLAAEAPTTPDSRDLALASDLLEIAVNLLPEVASRRMRRGEQQGAIESVGGVTDDAAAMALAEPTRPPMERARRALSLLEAGRAVLLGQTLDTRGDLTGLREAHPELAMRFTALRDFLDRDADPALPGDHDRIGATAELAATLREIRGLEGFGTFALPPAVDELLVVADLGPVVSLNVGYRGDALLLTGEGVTSLHLPAATGAVVIDQVNAFHVALREAHDPAGDRVAAQRALTAVLKWLWDKVTGPVFDALGYHGPPADGAPWPRVWWAPGGYLGLLPLHAAGHHDDPGSDETVMDRVGDPDRRHTARPGRTDLSGTPEERPCPRAELWTFRDHANGGAADHHTDPPGHPATRSPSHPVTRSPGHPVTRSPGHPVTRSPGHREGLQLACQFATFTGWMAQEMGNEDVALRWTERAAQLAEAAADDDLAAYAYVRRANLALYRGDPHATIALAKQARSMMCTPKVRRQALQREAQGHALAGDYPAFRACIEDARQMSFPEPPPAHPDEPTIGTMNVADPVALAEGWSLHDLGRSHEAVATLAPLFETTPEASGRAWARIGARLALAHAGTGDIDAACDIAERLMPLFPALESATIRSDLRLLARELNRWNTHPRVQLMMPKFSVALMPAQTQVVAG